MRACSYDIRVIGRPDYCWLTDRLIVPAAVVSCKLPPNVPAVNILLLAGSSFLVLIPQAAFTILYLWKITKASGMTFTTKYYVVPVPRYNARLHASASTGRSSTADTEAVRYMILVLAPFLAGFAVYSFAYHQYASWGEFALTTAVSAVYGSGFALMCPQLYINWKVREPHVASIDITFQNVQTLSYPFN